MAVLRFPKTRPDGSPLQAGDEYTGDNGVLYVYDGIKWVGHAPAVNQGSNSIVNNNFVVQIDTAGNLVIPNSATIIYESGTPVTPNVLVNNSFTVQLTSTGVLQFFNNTTSTSQDNFKISADNSIILATNASLTASLWTFSTDGSINFPDNTVQNTAWTGTMAWTQVTGNPPKGYTGSQGDIGYIGSQGDIGYIGSTGAGYIGSQGDIGYV